MIPSSAQPVIRPAVDRMLQAEEIIRAMRRKIIAPKQATQADEALVAIDNAIAELVAARVEIKAGHLTRAADRVAS
ncbi:hypothetical protein [Aurantimonas sp. 22II-16-19i]|uniref:hypothetical protein n=1 Tax=Aurantimonas sp. 22II-16-19i TaxID=1317114 RepID=UPI0009F7EF20|nr:hypothetical protein [Aurantimonas sp. 22II-16-19i]ORE98681.1 hypothetical protein ATO4_04175 [Aurantimonas sp. 22II-16-19i]